MEVARSNRVSLKLLVHKSEFFYFKSLSNIKFSFFPFFVFVIKILLIILKKSIIIMEFPLKLG